MNLSRLLGGAAALGLALAAAPALAQDEGGISWHDDWESAAKAAKEKKCVVFVYVHRLVPN